MTQKNWHRFLEAARAINARGDPITAPALSEELDIEGTAKSRPIDIAAGWISNLRRWGYLRKRAGWHKRPAVYELTRWGMEFRIKGAVKRKIRREAAN